MIKVSTRRSFCSPIITFLFCTFILVTYLGVACPPGRPFLWPTVNSWIPLWSPTLFPLGEITKPEVRQIAARLGLKTAFKKDSQDICFVGKKDYRSFVEKRIDLTSAGEIFDVNGNKVGNHNGIHQFTVGQRKGLPGGQATPRYVTKINVQNKNVIIGEQKDLLVESFIIEDVSIVKDIEYDNLSVQTRYNSEDLNCKINKISDNELLVELIEPASSIAPGQFGVLFSGTKVIGGGRISSKLMESAWWILKR